MTHKKGQNTVEYILLVVSVLLVCIFFFTKGPMTTSVNASLNSIVNQINNLNSQIQLP